MLKNNIFFKNYNKKIIDIFLIMSLTSTKKDFDTTQNLRKTKKSSHSKEKPEFLLTDSEYKFLDSQCEYISFPIKEVRDIAENIGMDIYSDNKYRWFLHMILLSELPHGWAKQYEKKGKVKYFNEVSKILTNSHPLSALYRRIFTEILKRSIKTINNNEDIKNSIISDISFENEENVFFIIS